jgi:hypothetical protein
MSELSNIPAYPINYILSMMIFNFILQYIIFAFEKNSLNN